MTVSIRNVSKRVRTARGKTPLFDGLNIEVGIGDRTALFGATGSGKTAVLNLMSGALEPDVGRVERHGFISWPLPSVPSLSKNLTGATNARFLARLYNLDEDEYLARVCQLTDVSRVLNDRMIYWPKQLKVEFSSALGLCLNFDTYLFDRQVAAGSKAFVALFMSALGSLEPHKSLFFATDNTKSAASFCTQAYVLYEKRAVHFPVLEEGIAFFNAINDTKGDIKEDDQEEQEQEEDDDAGAFLI